LSASRQPARKPHRVCSSHPVPSRPSSPTAPGQGTRAFVRMLGQIETTGNVPGNLVKHIANQSGSLCLHPRALHSGMPRVELPRNLGFSDGGNRKESDEQSNSGAHWTHISVFIKVPQNTVLCQRSAGVMPQSWCSGVLLWRSRRSWRSGPLTF